MMDSKVATKFFRMVNWLTLSVGAEYWMSKESKYAIMVTFVTLMSPKSLSSPSLEKKKVAY